MTNTPIDRIANLISYLEIIRDNALENEKEMREDDPLADNRDAMIATLEMIEDDRELMGPDDFDRLKDLILNA